MHSVDFWVYCLWDLMFCVFGVFFVHQQRSSIRFTESTGKWHPCMVEPIVLNQWKHTMNTHNGGTTGSPLYPSFSFPQLALSCPLSSTMMCTGTLWDIWTTVPCWCAPWHPSDGSRPSSAKAPRSGSTGLFDRASVDASPRWLYYRAERIMPI